MDKVFEIIDGIFDIYTEARSEVSIGSPSWKTYNQNPYKYYLNNTVSVKFDLEGRKLTIFLQNLSKKEEYNLLYPRFTSKGNNENDNIFFNFYFKVACINGGSGTIIVRAENIRNFRELYKSQYNVEMNDREDFFSMDEILDLQELVYRDLGLGNGLGEIPVDNSDLKDLYVTRSEYLYSINQLIINREEEYLKERLAYLGINRSIGKNILAGNYDGLDLHRMGLESSDIESLKFMQDLRQQNTIRKERLENGRCKYQISLEDILSDISKAIYFQEVECFTDSKNVMQVLRNSGFELEDINMCKLTQRLVYRLSKTNLSILEMLEMVFNHKRTLAQCFRIEDIQVESIDGEIKAIF